MKLLEFLRYVRSLYPPEVRIAGVSTQLRSPPEHKNDTRAGEFATENNVELAYVPFNASWLNRIEAQFTALCYFALDGTDHRSHQEQGQMICRYISWRNTASCELSPTEDTRIIERFIVPCRIEDFPTGTP